LGSSLTTTSMSDSFTPKSSGEEACR